MSLRPFHLAIALDGAGWHPGAADEPGARDQDRAGPSWWAQIVSETDRGPIGFVTIDDRRHDSGRPTPQLDALLIACRVAPITQNVGLVPQVSATLSEPFLVSTQLATLDFVSSGRAGWEVLVSRDPRETGYVGPRQSPPLAERYAEAAEHVEATQRLWDSWEDDAEIRDVATQRFIDRDRIHHIDFHGRHLSVSGPSITPRPPQGQPLTTATGHDQESDRFAAARADVAFIGAATLDALGPRLSSIRGITTATGETVLGPLCFADVAVFLDQSHAGAERRRVRLDQAAQRGEWPGLVFTGTPAELANWLLELAELGCDGVRLHPAAIPHDLYAITRELTALLPDSGAATRRTGTLRERLGFVRRASRYAVLS